MADEPRPVSRRTRRETSERPEAPVGGGGQAPEISAGLTYTSELPTMRMAEELETISVEQSQPLSSLTRKDRRRLERLEQPVETWTAEEEAQHTGTTPAMTPEAIAQQEALARRKAAAAQEDAEAASGSIPQVRPPATPQTQEAQLLQAEQAFPMGQPPPTQAFPQEEAPQFAPQQAIPPGGPGPTPMPPQGPLVVPQLVGDAPTMGVPMAPGGAQAQPRPPAPATLGVHAAGFEALVGGGGVQPQAKPPTIPVPQVGDPFQPPGFAPQPGMMPPPGQGMIVPGTGTIQTSTGTLRTIPGTGAIPRPVVEVHPAGGIRHFGWPQLLLLVAAGFALGVVIWNVAKHGS